MALEEPSALRTEPRCSHFGECGGCDWQHIQYAAQADAKRELLRDALVRIGRIEPPAEVPFHASPEPYAYRQRARLVAVAGTVGFRRRASHEVCAIDSCPVLAPELSASLARAALEEGEVELVLGVDGEVRVHPIGSARDDAPLHAPIDIAVRDERLRISPGVFAQANALLVGTLVDRVLALAGKGVCAAELFAGAGLFTLGLSRAFERVLAVEVSARATEDLVFNLARAGRANVEVLARSVDRALARVGRAEPEAIVLDPPREGLDATVAAAIASSGAARIVYVSCDPATLARDARAFIEADFELRALEGFDLFPQTAHVEAVALFER